MKPARLFIGAGALLVAAASIAAGPAASARSTATAARAAPAASHVAINCEYSSLCPEVANAQEAFGRVRRPRRAVGGVLLEQAGLGKPQPVPVVLPHDPSPQQPDADGKSYQFELNGALWFGMALCDTQSYPEQVSTCTPDSDSNIVDPAVSPNHPGTAFMELQFYPPGWVPWPTWAVAVGASTLRPDQVVRGAEHLQPAGGPGQRDHFRTRPARPRSASSPSTSRSSPRTAARRRRPTRCDSTLTTFTPDPAKDLFMNSGDRIRVTIHDTAQRRAGRPQRPDHRSVRLDDGQRAPTGSPRSSTTRPARAARRSPTTSTRCTPPRRRRPG